METSITSETISQQTICGNNEGLNADMETNKEPIIFERKQNQLNTAREIYFKYFLPQRKAWNKVTVRQKAMMGVPLAHSVTSTKRSGKKAGKGKKHPE